MNGPMRGAIWGWDLKAAVPVGGQELDGYTITDGGVSCAAAELAVAMELPLYEVERRQCDLGAQVLVAIADAGDVASWCWLTRTPTYAPPVRRTLRVAEDEGYGWGGGTHPDYQRRGLLTAILRYAGAMLAWEGRQVFWAGIHDPNIASQRACARAGYRAVLHVQLAAGLKGDEFSAWPVVYSDPTLVERALRLVSA